MTDAIADMIIRIQNGYMAHKDDVMIPHSKVKEAIAELLKRVVEDKVKELILATNASVEGESTALLITQALRGKKVKLTRLARGLPVGVDLEYADQITLTRALEGRQKM